MTSLTIFMPRVDPDSLSVPDTSLIQHTLIIMIATSVVCLFAFALILFRAMRPFRAPTLAGPEEESISSPRP